MENGHDQNISEAELPTHKSLEERSLRVRCSDAAPTICSLTVTVGFPIVNLRYAKRITHSEMQVAIYYRKSNSNGKGTQSWGGIEAPYSERPFSKAFMS